MRSYLDDYIHSLSKGEATLARDFIWSDRRHLASEIQSARTSMTATMPRFNVAYPMDRVNQSTYTNMFYATSEFIKAIFEQANKSAFLRTSLEEQADAKLSRIEDALQALEQEVDDWEAIISTAPEAVHTLTRNFEGGLRPLLEQEGTLQLLSTIVEANTEVTVVNGFASASVRDQIDEVLFSTDEGLQLRYIYTFVPGLVDQIKLEPLTGIGELTMTSIKVYGAQGNLVSKITEDEILSRTLSYSIPKTIVSRVEVEMIDRTFNLENRTKTTTTTVTGERRTVIPAKQEKIFTGYKDAPKVTTQTRRYGNTYAKPTPTVPSTSSSSLTPAQIANFNSAQKLAYEILPTVFAFQADWALTASRLQSQVMPAGYDPSSQVGSSYGGQPYGQEYFGSLAEGLRNNNTALTGFVVKNADGTYTKYWYNSVRAPKQTTPAPTPTPQIPTYEIIDIPGQVLIEPYTNVTSTTTIEKWYHYEGGLRNLTCSSSFYTELLQYTERICFDGGIPTYITLTTDEYLPAGSHINFFMIGDNKEIVPLLPDNREFTTDVLRFDGYGQASLNFYPEKEIYYYKDENIPQPFPTNGKTVLGPTNNLGAINTLGGSVFWARYQGNKDKANFLPYTSRVGSYTSPDGTLGEFAERIPTNGQLSLRKAPFIDQLRLDDSTYSPVQIVIDGYTTEDLTNYDCWKEDEFPIEPRYEDGERIIYYKLRGNTIFFDQSVDRPVRIFYEHVTQCVTLLIEMGVIHKKAACPVLYKYSMSYI